MKEKISAFQNINSSIARLLIFSSPYLETYKAKGYS